MGLIGTCEIVSLRVPLQIRDSNRPGRRLRPPSAVVPILILATSTVFNAGGPTAQGTL